MPKIKGKITKDFSKKKTFGRLMGYLFHSYPLLFTLTIICIVIVSIGSLAASIFLQKVIDDVFYAGIQAGGGQAGFDAVKGNLIKFVTFLGSIYIVALIASIAQAQIMAYMGQGFLYKMRKDLFTHMESLPISYFDRNAHGDIMSTYTNDVDAIRQLISQVIPSLTQTIIIVTVLFVIMLYYSIWLTLVVILATVLIYLVTKKVGGGSAKYFMRQQITIAKTEAFVEEMMSGQKVVKVFCHEEKANEDFGKVNDELNNNTFKANAYANMLGPIIHNIGNLLYVLVAIVAVILYINNATNIAISRLFGGDVTLSLGTAVTFLGMARQFANTFNQISTQLNSVVMGLAGADRVFDMMDQQSETDEGFVTLVNANIDSNGNITETSERTGHWAWRYPNQDGTVKYTELKGDIRLDNVDFGYFKDKIVLHDVTIFAKPGQKIALVGSTGAGKTTITNLINRFYDIADGKVHYDGININEIKKDDLRRSIGIVLQDTNLFTGTVKDNIRYGRLDATDEEIYEAAKIANAYDFITRLPQGFDTMLTGNGSQLSQGQRQLISIARAALADAPVMILDEATSSIDTRTEAIVSKGMDGLMEGRTVFVIAHRLSTIRNSNAIMVLDHGRIIERGDHDDLIKAHGVYYQLYTGAFELE